MYQFDTPQGRRLAYIQTEGAEGRPGIVFLGGFRSDMTGTKAAHLEAWAKSRGNPFLRFDYSGHGASSGTFDEGSIGDWAADAAAIIAARTTGPQILAGSSMGGWIALLLTRQMPEKIAGVVGIATAPDFTEDGFHAGFTPAQHYEMAATGRVLMPSDYGDPIPITARLIDDGRRNLVLRDPLQLPFPVRLLQGTDDADVSESTATRLLAHATGQDITLTLVKGADHRFSTPRCLALIEAAVADIQNRAG